MLALAREDLLHDGAGAGMDGRIAIGLTYLDGYGRLLQQKSLVEPGPAIRRDAAGKIVLDTAGQPVLAPAELRWRTSGHTVYDAKQRPIRTYEAFFTPSPAFEGDDVLRQFGVATLVSYDAASRPVGQHFPNGTFTRTRIAAWQTEEADPNDTVMESPWRVLREALPTGAAERQALEEAKPHADTTRLTFLDPLGRAVASLAKGGATAPDRRIEAKTDIEGRGLAVIDPRGLTAFRYRRDMQGRLVQQDSVDAGQSFALADAYDRDAIGWDARGFVVRRGYDVADRPTFVEVTGGDGPTPLDHRIEEYIYGESFADRDDARRRNLLGQAIRVRDCASESTLDRCDPDGHSLAFSRRLRAATNNEPDWRASVPLDPEIIQSAATFDGMGRIHRDTLADGSTRFYEYLTGGALARVLLTTPDGKLGSVPILDGTTGGARGELTGMRLGNGVQIAYAYEPDTQRLATQTATRGDQVLQQLGYTYDPVGNIVRITDAAQEGAGALITGISVPAQRDHIYDAHYRLRRATGRVHQALLQWDTLPGVTDTIKGTRRLSFNDGAAVERYTRSYDYDAGGNLTRIRHIGATRSWTTDFWISPSSNRSLPALDPGGNALVNAETKFDATGNLRELPNLRLMDWNWAGLLTRTVAIVRTGETDDAERYVYGADGYRVLKETTRLVQPGLVEVTEKAYFGDAERKRIRRNGQIVLESWTLHVGNGDERIALVHRWTRDDLAREVDDIAQPRVRYQLSGQQRSAVMELDEAGNLISYEEYFPYGDTAFVVGDDLREVERREYRYSGKERDDFTGLYYYGFRYLVPWMGRWLSVDPIGPSDDLNLYQFVLGDPVSNIDAEGLQTDTLQRFGSVDADLGAEEAMAAFNATHASKLGFVVTELERTPNGDWLIKATRPNSRVDFAAEDPYAEDDAPAEGDTGSGGGDDGQDGSPAGGGAGKADTPHDGSGSTEAELQGGDATNLGEGNGGQGKEGEGKDASGHGPAKQGDTVPLDQSAKDGKAGGAGVGTGTGSSFGAGAAASPIPKHGPGGTGDASQAPGGVARPEGTGAGTGEKHRAKGTPGGDPKGVAGGRGTKPSTHNATKEGGKSEHTGNGGGNGGLTDAKLTSTATGQPPAPGVKKQGKDPNGPIDGGTADTARPEAPGNASGNRGNGLGTASNGQGNASGDVPTGTDTGAGHAGTPTTTGDSDGSPEGSDKGIAGGGGHTEWGFLGRIGAYIGKGVLKTLEIGFAVAEIAAGLALLILPEPVLTKVAGAMLVFHGADSLFHAIFGGRTWTAQIVTGIAKSAGASNQTADMLGALADVALPLLAGGIGLLGKLRGFGKPLGPFLARIRWGIESGRSWAGKVPGTKWLTHWYVQGSELDAELNALTKGQRALAGLGQRTLASKAWKEMGKALGILQEEQSVMAMIARGAWIKNRGSGSLLGRVWKLLTYTLWKTGASAGIRNAGGAPFAFIFASWNLTKILWSYNP